MGYLIKAILGAALFVGALVLFNVKLVSLLETGTCASGNTPYVIANECPEGTGTDIMLLIGSVFAGLVGAGIFAFRGEPPWGSRRRSRGLFGWGTFAWGLFFGVTGAVSLISSLSNETIGPDGELGGAIVGGTFLLMGVPALVLSLWGLLGGLMRRDEAAAGLRRGEAVPVASGASGLFGPGAAGSSRLGAGGIAPTAGRDVLGRLERLQRLRESGALTDGEFEREKAKILGS